MANRIQKYHLWPEDKLLETAKNIIASQSTSGHGKSTAQMISDATKTAAITAEASPLMSRAEKNLYFFHNKIQEIIANKKPIKIQLLELLRAVREFLNAKEEFDAQELKNVKKPDVPDS